MTRAQVAIRLLLLPLLVSCSRPAKQKEAAVTASQAPIQVEPIVNDKALVIVYGYDQPDSVIGVEAATGIQL